jgi:Ca2+-binding EF-hand superfamily protein
MKLTQHASALAALALTAVVLEANPNDRDKDKRISWPEFEAFQQREAAKNSRKHEAQQARYLFEDKDRDGDGFLSYQEFGRNPVDLNDDKSISLEEFSAMMKKRGERTGRTMKDDWIKETFAKKDTDGSGSLSYQELAKPVQP